MNNTSIGLILYGQIVNIDHLEERLIYYKKYISNIILITFEISVIKFKSILMKYINEDNLILIPSNKIGNNIKNKAKITPYKITQPNNTFYYDSSWFKLTKEYKKKGTYHKFCVYKYFKLYGKKYDHYLLLRNDVDITLNESILETMIKMSNNDKIVLGSLKYYQNIMKKDKIKGCMDKLNNFIIKHPYQNDKNIMCFYTSCLFFCGKYEKIYNYLKIINNNNNFNYNIWCHGESWLIGPYILKMEKIEHTKSISNTERLINKYFAFIDHCEDEKDNINMHLYMNRTYLSNKDKYFKDSKYPCFICKKKNVLV